MQHYVPSISVGHRISHYEIESLLGWGGMGEVFRAYDSKLHRQVAIKVVRSRGDDPVEHGRFLREAQSSAQIDHPAVVRIFHIGEEEGRDYVVMELVEGTNLAVRLRKGPDLGLRRTVVYLKEIAEGLAEAHGHGIVHRDLKAENLMITPQNRAKILDFGLAKRLSIDEATRELSEPGMIRGTLHTMSPEQVDGEDVDPRSDLFSFGVVCYQALTGTAPFMAHSARQILARVCAHHPPPVSDLDPRIPHSLSALVVDLLQKDRQRRPSEAGIVVEELDRILESGELERVSSDSDEAVDPAAVETQVAAPMGTAGSVSRNSQSGAGRAEEDVVGLADDDHRAGPAASIRPASLLAFGLCFIAVLLIASWRHSGQTVSLRPSVAVIGIEGIELRPEDDWLGIAIGEILSQEMGIGDGIRVVDSERTSRARRELGFEPGVELTDEATTRLGKYLMASYVISGTYEHIGEDTALVDIDLKLQEVGTGETLEARASGAPEQLFKPLWRMVEEFRKEMGVKPPTSAQELEVESRFPKNAEALMLYSEGLGHLYGFRFEEAYEALAQSVSSEPTQPATLVPLATALTALDDPKVALKAAKKAIELSESLPWDHHLRLAARANAAAEQWDPAAEGYQRLFDLFPDDFETGFRLAEAQFLGGHSREALAALEELRRFPEPFSKAPRLGLLESKAYSRLSDQPRALDSARQARDQAKALGAWLLEAQTWIAEAVAQVSLGDLGAAMAAGDEALALFEEAGDRLGYAEVLDLLAYLQVQHGDISIAQSLHSRAVAIYEEIGDQSRRTGLVVNFAAILIPQGRLAEAIEALETELEKLRPGEAKADMASVLNNLGANYQLLGDFHLAIDRYREALSLYDDASEEQGSAIARSNIGEVLFAQGNLDLARTMHEEALAINWKIRRKAGIAYDTFCLGRVLAAQGDLYVARQKLQEAIEIQEAQELPVAAATTKTELATLALAELKFEEAELLAREAEQVLRQAKNPDRALMARTILVRALVAAGETGEARRVLEEGREVAEMSQDQEARFMFRFAEALSKSHKTRQAVADLRSLAAEVEAAGFLGLSLKIWLDAGETEIRVGNRSAALKRLESLSAKARAKGYEQIARRAAEAMAQPRELPEG